MKHRKISALIPPEIMIETKYMYWDFRKKGYRVLREIDVRKCYDITADKTQTPKLLKIFKTLKYVNKFQKILMPNQPLAQSKVLYMAKRVSNARIFIDCVQLNTDSPKSLSGLWIKSMKRIRSLGAAFNGSFGRRTKFSKQRNFFLEALRFQSGLKNLKIDTSDVPTSVSNYFWKLEKYPATLARLSCFKLDSKKQMTSSLEHLKNLKHLEISSNLKTNYKTVLSIVAMLPPIASHLQSLGLSWLGTQMSDIKSATAAIKTLNHLTCLKLSLHCTNKNHFETLFEAFREHSLIHLVLKPHLSSEAQLISIADFIKRHPHLKSLNLKITCDQVLASFKNTERIFQEIDNLTQVTRLSVSIISSSKKNQSYPEFSPILNKIYTKPILLESFKIQLRPSSISNENFFVLIDSIKPLTSTLKKLKIDVGQYTPDQSEFQKVLDFVKILKNIQSLKLYSLTIPVRLFFREFVEIILEEMPFLRTLILGEVKAKVTKPVFYDIINRLLQKRGISEFNCTISDSFRSSLTNPPKGYQKLSLEMIKNSNPFLIKYPLSSVIISENEYNDDHFIW